MVSIYKPFPVKRRKYSFASKPDDKILRMEIAESISEYCTESLLAVVRQLNENITNLILTDLITEGLE